MRDSDTTAEDGIEQVVEEFCHLDKGLSSMSPNPVQSAVCECYLGIDPGLNRTGYAVLRRGPKGPVLCEGGVIRSTQEKTLAERVHEIGEGLREVCAQYNPQVMAIEQIFSTVQFPKTAILMAHARGAILYAAAEHKLEVVHYAAKQIKRLLTGSGKASKEQMQDAVQRELRLKQRPEPNDVADACAVALCHYHHIRLPTAIGA